MLFIFFQGIFILDKFRFLATTSRKKEWFPLYKRAPKVAIKNTCFLFFKCCLHSSSSTGPGCCAQTIIDSPSVPGCCTQIIIDSPSVPGCCTQIIIDSPSVPGCCAQIIIDILTAVGWLSWFCCSFSPS